MSIIYYNNNVGSISATNGTSDFLVLGAATGYTSFSTYSGQYLPYYARTEVLPSEWEYGLAYVDGTTLVRSIVYTSSNNNNKVNFSTNDIKIIYSTINAERINHGGTNYIGVSGNFTASTSQSVYGVLATGTFSTTGNLPSASGNENLVLGFKILPASTKSLVIVGSGSQTIEGSSSLTLTGTERFISLISDGSGWLRLDRSTEVTGSGLPSGIVGSVQYKQNSSSMGGDSYFVWDSGAKNLLIGGSGVSFANIVLPGSSGQNTIINNSGYDSDFIVKGTGVYKLYFDASTGRFGVNTTPQTIFHVSGTCAAETARIESSTACNTGVILTLYHSPTAGSDVGDFPGTINLAGRNSNGQQVNYARIRSRVLGTGINATSGEFFVDTDHTGVSKNILVLNPFQALLGLEATGNYRTNIVVGNYSKDQGSTNVVIGHYAAVSGSGSSGNVIFGNYSTAVGLNVIVGGNNSYASGTNVFSIGDQSVDIGSGLISVGSSAMSGTGLVAFGQNNSATGNYAVVCGNLNSLLNGTSGLVLGSYNTVVSGSNNVIGLNNTVSGTNNTAIGLLSTVSGSDNSTVGNRNIISGVSNFLLGNDIRVTGNSGVFIGNSINYSGASNSGVLIGVQYIGLAVSSSGLQINPQLASAFTTSIYGNALSNGVFVSGNKVGIHKSAPANELDVSGLIRTSGLFTDGFRLGTGVTSQYSFILSDASGSGYWSPLSTVKTYIVSGLNTNQITAYDGVNLVSCSGLYFSNATGIYTSISGSNSSTAYAHIIIPTGEGGLVVNNRARPISGVLLVKGDTNPNLLNVDGVNSYVGVNLVPSYHFDVSGTTRLYTDTLNYVLRNSTNFIIAYDEGPSTLRRIDFSSTGIFVTQANTGLIPKIIYGASLLSSGYLADSVNTITSATYNSNSLKFLLWDNSDYKIKYADDMYGGFGNFGGSTDN